MGRVLGYETRSKLTEEELGGNPTDAEEAVARFGKVSLLVYVSGYLGWTWAPPERILSSTARARSKRPLTARLRR